MQGSDLRRLAKVAALGKADYTVFPFHLSLKDGVALAQYAGTFSIGKLEVWPDESGGDKPFDVYLDAMHFVEHAKMFQSNDNIQLWASNGALHLKGAGVELALKEVYPDDRGLDIIESNPDDETEIPGDDFLEEVKLASEFTARSMSNQTLTGLHICCNQSQFQIESADGFSSCFISTLTIPNVIGDEVDVVISAYDMVVGVEMALVPGSPLWMYIPSTKSNVRNPNRLGIKTASGNFQCALLSGAWPDFSSVTKIDYDSSTKVLVDTEKVKLLAQSSSIFQARSIVLRPTKTRTVLHLSEESGQMAIELDGPPVSGPRKIRLDSLVNLSKLGAMVELSVPIDIGKPIRATSGMRSVWVSPMV